MKENEHGNARHDSAKASRRSFLKAGATLAGAAFLADVLNSLTARAAVEDQPDMEEVQLLFVQNALDVTLAKERLTLIGANPTTIFFSDRPKRIAGHMFTEDFVLDWQEETGKESFHANPPNAALSVFGDEEVVDVIVTLKNPRLAGGALIKVITEQQNIRIGDCVAVERGKHVNIRQVGDVHCEVDYKPKPPPHHQASADECQNAKQELVDAKTDDAVDMAVKKVRVLCEH